MRQATIATVHLFAQHQVVCRHLNVSPSQLVGGEQQHQRDQRH